MRWFQSYNRWWVGKDLFPYVALVKCLFQDLVPICEFLKPRLCYYRTFVVYMVRWGTYSVWWPDHRAKSQHVRSCGETHNKQHWTLNLVIEIRWWNVVWIRTNIITRQRWLYLTLKLLFRRVLNSLVWFTSARGCHRSSPTPQTLHVAWVVCPVTTPRIYFFKNIHFFKKKLKIPSEKSLVKF